MPLPRSYTWQCQADNCEGVADIKDREKGFSIMQVELQVIETMIVAELHESGIKIRSNIVHNSDKLHYTKLAYNY
jgi:hypothetical protein